MFKLNLGKKKTSCCGGKCESVNLNAKYLVLGACCKKSSDTFANVQTALKQLNINEEVVNVGDNIEIAKFGVMQTPALVINGKVVSYGKLISVEEAIKLIQEN